MNFPFLRSAAASLLVLVSVCCSGDQLARQRTDVLQAKVNLLATHLRVKQQSGSITQQEFDARYRQTAQALEAWNQSGRTTEDAARMNHWLDRAIAASQLGASRAMPALPAFSESLPPRPMVVAKAQPTEKPAPKPRSIIKPPTSVPQPVRAKQSPKQLAQRPSTAHPKPVAKQAEWDTHPAAAELNWGDPFADDSPRMASTSRQRESRFKPISNSPVRTGEAVRVDLLELSSRVAGHNSKLRELEGSLLGVRDISAFRLAALLRDFDELQDERSFLSLYLKGLSPTEAELGPRLDSTKPLLRLLAKAAEDRRESLLGQPGSRAEAERAILSALDRKLAQW